MKKGKRVCERKTGLGSQWVSGELTFKAAQWSDLKHRGASVTSCLTLRRPDLRPDQTVNNIERHKSVHLGFKISSRLHKERTHTHTHT